MIQILVRLILLFSISIGVISCSSADKDSSEMNNEVSAALDEEESADDFDGDEDEDDEEADDGDELAAEDGEDEDFEDEDFEDEDEEEVAEAEGEDEDDADSEQVAEEEDELEEMQPEEEIAELQEPIEQEGASLEDELQNVDASAESVSVSNISYKANQAGGTVVVDFTGTPTYQTRINPETNQFVIEISNAILPDNLKRPLITNEFNSAIKGVNAYQNTGSNTARIIVQMANPQEPLVQLEGQSLLIIPSTSSMSNAEAGPAEAMEPMSEPMPEQTSMSTQAGSADSWSYDTSKAKSTYLKATSLEEYLRGSTVFYGRRISLETTKDADIRDVLRFISEQSGVNMVISDSVKGSIQLKIRQVPWDQAFLIVLRTKQLGYIRQGNVLRIATLKDLENEASSAKKVLDASKSLEPLRVKVIPVSYAKVKDLAGQVKPFLSKIRGSVVSDNRTSSLILKDTDEVIKKIARLVKELDVPPAQVMIEGKIVEAGEEFTDAMGVNWGASGDSVTLSEGGGAGGGPVNFTGSFASSALDLTTNTANTGVLNLNVGRLKGLGMLSLTLALEETKNNVNIISSPRIMAINKEKATIEQIGEVFSKVVEEKDGKVVTSIKRHPYKLKLEVTPQITSAGSVIMDLNLKREFPGALDPTFGVAPINTRQATTKTLVNNNQTAVVGGIFQNDKTVSERGVPVLQNLPLLGWLFKSKLSKDIKTELLIFLTPRVINQIIPGSVNEEPIVLEMAENADSGLQEEDAEEVEELDESEAAEEIESDLE